MLRARSFLFTSFKYHIANERVFELLTCNNLYVLFSCMSARYILQHTESLKYIYPTDGGYNRL